jgi:hypothetical protein
MVIAHLGAGVRWPVKPTNMPGERWKRPHLLCALSHENPVWTGESISAGIQDHMVFNSKPRSHTICELGLLLVLSVFEKSRDDSNPRYIFLKLSWLNCSSSPKSERTPSIAGTILQTPPCLQANFLPPVHHTEKQPSLHLDSLGNTVVPLDTLNPVRVAGSFVQVHTRVVVVVGPGSQEISGADAAVARLAAVEVPGAGGEVDRVARVVHGDVDVVVAFVLVGGGALSAGEGC